MVLSFKYKDVPRSNGTKALSPSIPVTLYGNNLKLDVIALLDSGADISAIPRSMAEVLNLNLNGKKESTFGIGGEVSAIETYVNVEIGKPHDKYSFKIPVKVILEGKDFPPLIGRAVFFDKFDITFKQSEKRVSLKPVQRSNF